MKTKDLKERNVQLDVFNKEQLVSIQDGKVVTSSLQVAKYFEKEHRHVLRDIRDIDCSSKFKESNFGLSFYIRELQGRGQHKYPMYYMTKDGFTFLVMGFTGKQAAKFKEDYINAFNKMEAYIKEHTKIGKSNEKQISEMVSKYLTDHNKSLMQYSKELSSRFNFPVLTPDIMPYHWNAKDDLKTNIYNLIICYRYNTASGLFNLYMGQRAKAESEVMRNLMQDFVSRVYKDVNILPH